MGEAGVAGALVEVADEGAGGGEEDGVASGGDVVLPGGEGVVGHGGEVTDVDASGVEVEAERGCVAVPEGEGRGGFGVVGEPHQLGQVHRAVAGGDVA